MTPEAQVANITSWDVIESQIERYSDTRWGQWKVLAHRLLLDSRNLGLHKYFRAGQSMHHVVFSTLDHHGLLQEPRVTVEFHPPDRLRLAYGTSNLNFPDIRNVEYLLSYDSAFPTFRRFLKQLWIATMPEPVPAEIAENLAAPVLSASDRLPR